MSRSRFSSISAATDDTDDYEVEEQLDESGEEEEEVARRTFRPPPGFTFGLSGHAPSQFPPVLEAMAELSAVATEIPDVRRLLDRVANRLAGQNIGRLDTLLLQVLLARVSLAEMQYQQQLQDALRISLEESQDKAQGAPPATEEDIANLPLVTVAKEHIECTDKSTCVVCLEPLKIGQSVKQLPCSHMFCETCIAPWLRRHNTCPLCREAVQEIQPSPYSYKICGFKQVDDYVCVCGPSGSKPHNQVTLPGCSHSFGQVCMKGNAWQAEATKIPGFCHIRCPLCHKSSTIATMLLPTDKSKLLPFEREVDVQTAEFPGFPSPQGARRNPLHNREPRNWSEYMQEPEEHEGSSSANELDYEEGEEEEEEGHYEPMLMSHGRIRSLVRASTATSSHPSPPSQWPGAMAHPRHSLFSTTSSGSEYTNNSGEEMYNNDNEEEMYEMQATPDPPHHPSHSPVWSNPSPPELPGCGTHSSGPSPSQRPKRPEQAVAQSVTTLSPERPLMSHPLSRSMDSPMPSTSESISANPNPSPKPATISGGRTLSPSHGNPGPSSSSASYNPNPNPHSPMGTASNVLMGSSRSDAPGTIRRLGSVRRTPLIQGVLPSISRAFSRTTVACNPPTRDPNHPNRMTRT